MNVVFSPVARKALRSLPNRDAEALIARLKAIAADPVGLGSRRHPNVKDFGDGLFRARHGDWRAIFTLDETTLTVLKIGHRREIYR